MTYAAKCRYCNVAPVVERAPVPPKCGHTYEYILRCPECRLHTGSWPTLSDAAREWNAGLGLSSKDRDWYHIWCERCGRDEYVSFKPWKDRPASTGMCECGEPDILGFHEDYLGLGHFDRYVFYRRGRP